jgi:anti-sigma factor RsiW
MPCENYREALIEAAAGDSAPPRELRSHLDACASCRAAFSEEQQLFAAIDTGLRATANAEAPASLFPRVRAQLVERPASRRSWIPAFAGVGIAAALLVALVLVLRPARNGSTANPQALVSQAHDLAPAGKQPVTQAAVTHEIAQTARKRARVEAAKTAPARDAADVEAEVLIPAGQKRAMDVLLAGLQTGEVQGEALLAEKPEEALKTLEVSPLDISPIEIKLLPEVETNSATSEEKIQF